MRQLTLWLLLASAGRAGTLWFQGPPNDGSSNIVDYRLADDFVLGQASVVTNVTFWYQAQFQDDLSSVAWAFYADAVGALGSTLASGVARPDTFLDVNAYMASFAIPAVFLPAGTGWLELHSGSSLTDTTGFTVWWASADDNATDNALQDIAPAQPQTPISLTGYQQYAFQLDGAAAPEPASVLLVLGAFCTFCRKRM